MIADALRRLDAIAPPSTYSYLGFGALEFVDFKLLHRALGIVDMTSIEKDTHNPSRYEFNRPYATIQVRMGRAGEVFPSLDWSGRKIVWLDYEQHLDKEVLRDIQAVARRLVAGSVLIVTVCARHTSESDGRVEVFAERVGEERVPPGTNTVALGARGLPKVQRTLMTEALDEVSLGSSPSVEFKQIFNFRYADDAPMQTLGWVVSEIGTRAVANCRFEESPFVREGGDAFELRVPVLTAKEVSYLNRRLPLTDGDQLDVQWLSEDDLRQYASAYRWYPEILTLA